MRSFSFYLDSVKQPKLPKFRVNLAGTTPSVPRVPTSLPFEAGESRWSAAYRDVMKQLASLYGVGGERIGLTVGSSSAFLHSLSAVTREGDTVLIESPCYEPYIMTARYLGLKITQFRRTGDIDRDLKAMKSARGRSKVLIISNPNSPTGLLYSKSELARISRAFETVIVDEIFLPVFAGEISRTGSLANVISLSGMSKTLGLSSLRVGWMKASPRVIRASDQIALNTYVDVPTLPLVGASLILPRFIEIVVSHQLKADANRPVLREFAARFPGVLSHDFTQGHFGTMRVPRRFATGTAFARELHKHSIAVCPCEPFGMKGAVRFNAMAEAGKFKRALSTITRYY